MSLQIPNLDDKTFEELFTEGRALIPRYAQQWTDHNFSDPGITFIDLFAWLAEMQIYSTNRITPGHKLKFLKYLQTLPKPATPSIARVFLTLKNTIQSVPIPPGTLLFAVDKLTGLLEPFETIEPVTVSSASISMLFYLKNDIWYDVSGGFASKNGYFQPFDQSTPTQGRLLIGLNQATSGNPLRVHFDINENFSLLTNPPTTESDRFPSVTLIWEIWNGASWQALSIEDDTCGLIHSGDIIISGMEKARESSLHDISEFQKVPYTNPLTWISATPSGNHGEVYEIPPQIHSIRLHSVPVIHGQTWRNESYNGTGLPKQNIELKNAPILDGTIRVLLRKIRLRTDDKEWIEVMDFNSSEKNDYHFKVDISNKAIHFNEKLNQIRSDTENVTIITIFKKYYNGSGKPFQKFFLREPPVEAQNVKVMINNQQWSEISNFSSSKPDDLHFTINYDEGTLCFGDGKHGSIPSKGNENILITSECESMGSMEPSFPIRFFNNIPMSTSTITVSVTSVEWTEVFDFDASKPNDPHFTVDCTAGLLKFGDGEHGDIPPVSDKNIIIESYRSGGGIRGNIASDKIIRFDNPEYNTVIISGSSSGSGGSEQETLDQTLDRARRERKIPTRLISADDIEQLAFQTPGTRMHSARALFGYHPLYCSITMPGTCTLLVVPAVENVYAVPPVSPSNGFINRIKRFINQKRLITTDLHITGPEYKPVSVSAQLYIRPNMNSESIRTVALNTLNNFLNPFIGGHDNKGWEPGYPVIASDLIAILQNIEGIVCVKNVILSSSDGIQTDNKILLSKTGIAYSSGHFLTVLTD